MSKIRLPEFASNEPGGKFSLVENVSSILLGSSNIPVPKDDAELKDAIKEYCNVNIPDVRICPGHTTPFHALADAFFARNSMSVWKASRAFGGKSVTLATLGFLEVSLLGAYVNLLGGSGQQSKRVHEYMTGEDTNLPGSFWGAPGAPTHLLRGSPSGMSTRLRNRGKINVLMASQTSVRGPHPQRLRLDEVDEMSEAIFDAAMGQTMEARGIKPQTVISSTHQHPDGVMTKALRMANERGWPVYEWCVGKGNVIMSPFGLVPIEKVRKGDIIYAYKDGRVIITKVTDAWCSGKRSTLTIAFDNGAITCTPEHRFLTDSGWTRADQLKSGSVLLGLRQENGKARSRDTQQNWYLSGVQIEAQTITGISRQLSKLWKTKASSIKALSRLLQKRNDAAQQGTSWIHGDFKRETIEHNTWEPQQDSEQSKRTIGLSELRICGRSAIQAIFSRFFASILFLVHRSQWNILAFATCSDRERSKENASYRAGGLFNTHSQRGKYPSLGNRIVKSVESWKILEVYDLTVEEGESFICEGVIVHNCYRENLQGWLTPEAVVTKKTEVSKSMWDTEFELQEPNPEGRAIVPEKVEEMFKRELGEYLGGENEEITIEEPVEEGEYCTGGDWAKETNWSIIWTFRVDVFPVRLVAFGRYGRRPYPEMVKRFNDRVKKYPGEAFHDATGLGDVIDDYITEDALGIVLSGARRKNILSNFVIGIEDNQVVAPYIEFAYNEFKYARNDDLYGSGHLPDAFCAGALAYIGATTGVWTMGAGN